jgi:molecular chaperone DnaK (HSP70)
MKISIDLKSGDIAASPKKDIIIGIDLGTTNSLVAYMHGESPAIISNKYTKERIVPSLVYFDDDFKPVVGSAVREFQSDSHERCIYSVKRLMGKAFSDIKPELSGLGYKVIGEGERLAKIEISNGKEVFPIHLACFWRKGKDFDSCTPNVFIVLLCQIARFSPWRSAILITVI